MPRIVFNVFKLRTIEKFILIIQILLLANIFPLLVSNSHANISEESLTLNNIEVSEEILHYYLYLPPQEPIGAVLIIPHKTGNHESYLIGDFGEGPEENMLESPFVHTARLFRLAIVFAEGAVANYYAPDNGEMKVLACMEDANTSFLQLPSTKWFIYGFSMGGMGALTIFVRHPDLFSGVFSAGGITDFRKEIFLIEYRRTWPSDEAILSGSPHHHLYLFHNKALFLAVGLRDYIYHFYDNFSRMLDIHAIRHYYYRGDEGHTYRLLFNTMNSTFEMFSLYIQGSLDSFFEGYTSPLSLTMMETSRSDISTEVSTIFSSKSWDNSHATNWINGIISTLMLFSLFFFNKKKKHD
ncbi:MAG: alpha/beta hydrolase-fold protein [Candidatus Thorarchaeota archaeon]